MPCSEGFGIPIVESAAVGCPVIVANNTAPPDNVFNGEIVDNYQKKFVYMVSIFARTFVCIVNVGLLYF